MVDKKLCYTPKQLLDIIDLYSCAMDAISYSNNGLDMGGLVALDAVKKLKTLIPEEFHSSFRLHGMEKIISLATMSTLHHYDVLHPYKDAKGKAKYTEKRLTFFNRDVLRLLEKEKVAS